MDTLEPLPTLFNIERYLVSKPSPKSALFRVEEVGQSDWSVLCTSFLYLFGFCFIDHLTWGSDWAVYIGKFFDALVLISHGRSGGAEYIGQFSYALILILHWRSGGADRSDPNVDSLSALVEVSERQNAHNSGPLLLVVKAGQPFPAPLALS